jgi:hypothetical protein
MEDIEHEIMIDELICPECKQWAEFEWIEGYPGESLGKCLTCGEITKCNFNESAIM